MKRIKINGYNSATMTNIGIITDSVDEAMTWLNDVADRVNDGVAHAHSGAWNYISSVRVDGIMHKISRANYRHPMPSIDEARAIVNSMKR